jgi:dihydrodipicolinate synthase/N-acetylneuraminate lyase
MAELNGIVVSAITPRGKKGDVDLSAAFELIDFLCAGGVRGIAFFGVAGEFAAAELEERARLVHLACKRSRVPVYAGVGTATLDGSVALARQACNSDVAAVLLPPPLFFQLAQDEIREYCCQFRANVGVGLDCFLYNIPPFCSAIDPDTAAELIRSGYCGVVDASGDRSAFEALRLAAPDTPVVNAADAMFAEARMAGAPGVFSDAGCAIPEVAAALDHAIENADSATIQILDELFREFLDWGRRLPQSACVRAAVETRGLKTGGFLLPMSAERRRLLDEFREWFKGWLPEALRKAHA